MLRKSLFIVLMALFVFSFIGVAAVSAEMVVKDDAGEMKSLIADPKAGVDLKSLKEGDPVSVESDANGVIKSLEVSK